MSTRGCGCSFLRRASEAFTRDNAREETCKSRNINLLRNQSEIIYNKDLYVYSISLCAKHLIYSLSYCLNSAHWLVLHCGAALTSLVFSKGKSLRIKKSEGHYLKPVIDNVIDKAKLKAEYMGRLLCLCTSWSKDLTSLWQQPEPLINKWIEKINTF